MKVTPKSLRSRVASTVGIIATVLGLLGTIAGGFASWQNVRSAATDRAETLAYRVADLGDKMPNKVETLKVPSDEVAMAITADGFAMVADSAVSNRIVKRALKSTVIDSARVEFVSFSVEQIGSTQWTFASLLCSDQEVCGTIVTGASTPNLRTYLLERWPWGLLGSIFVGGISFLTAYWLVGRSLRPIELMRKELSSITTSNLSRRVTLTKSGDEVERVGVTLNETLDRLDHAVQANERFVADAAHELRSPLTGIRLALEIETANKANSLLGDALTEVDRATRLVDDLLILAVRPSSASKRTDVDLDDLIRHEVATFRVRHPNVAITHELQAARVVGEPEALRRVITNLLDNAAFYGTSRVEIALTISSSNVQFVVSDDGGGIAPSDRERVFERFTRLDTSRARATGGSGLGLAIVKEIIDDHRGSIAISDAPQGGAAFTVTLARAFEK
jgi:signal transduction histidine kinase